MLVSAVFWFTGFLVGSLGIATGQLWLLYLGYGILGGIGLGIGYISPVSALIKWFPDRPGLATGMAIMGGGSSAITAAVAAGFVGMLSLANMGGRFVWSALSDYIGRKPIYMLYLGVGAVMYLLLASTGHNATWMFVVFALVIISFYGAGFATVPAYLKDLFGTLEVGAIHGRPRRTPRRRRAARSSHRRPGRRGYR